jgi:hypothetical protein
MGTNASEACERVRETLADVVEGTASDDVLAHLAHCQRCQELRRGADRARDLVARAGAAYVVPVDIVERVMGAVEQPGSLNVERSAIKPTLRGQRSALLSSMRGSRGWSRAWSSAFVAVATLGVLVFVSSSPRQKSHHHDLSGGGGANGSHASLSPPVRVGPISRASFEPQPAARGGLQICTRRPSSAREEECHDGSEGDVVSLGDHLRTDGQTRAQLVLPDGSRVVLQRETEVEIVGTTPAAMTPKLIHGVLSSDVALPTTVLSPNRPGEPRRSYMAADRAQEQGRAREHH